MQIQTCMHKGEQSHMCAHGYVSTYKCAYVCMNFMHTYPYMNLHKMHVCIADHIYSYDTHEHTPHMCTYAIAARNMNVFEHACLQTKLTMKKYMRIDTFEYIFTCPYMSVHVHNACIKAHTNTHMQRCPQV